MSLVALFSEESGKEALSMSATPRQLLMTVTGGGKEKLRLEIEQTAHQDILIWEISVVRDNCFISSLPISLSPPPLLLSLFPFLKLRYNSRNIKGIIFAI